MACYLRVPFMDPYIHTYSVLPISALPCTPYVVGSTAGGAVERAILVIHMELLLEVLEEE